MPFSRLSELALEYPYEVGTTKSLSSRCMIFFNQDEIRFLRSRILQVRPMDFMRTIASVLVVLVRPGIMGYHHSRVRKEQTSRSIGL